MSDERELGRVESADVTLDRDGVFLAFQIAFRFGGSGQCFGGIALDDYDKSKARRVGTAAGADLLRRLMEVFGVTRFRDIEGKIAFVERRNGLIVAVEMPACDGGKRLHLDDWRREWGFAP